MLNREDEQIGLTRAISGLSGSPSAAAAVASIEADFRGLLRALRRSVYADVPAFEASGNPDVVPEADRHVEGVLRAVAGCLDGHGAGDFEFVREHARRLAVHRFPLEALLRAYRCLFRELPRRLGGAGPGQIDIGKTLDAFLYEYSNTLCSIAAAAYVEETRQLSEAAGDRRSELFNILLSGYDEADGRVARLLRRDGYLDQRQAYCVAALQPAIRTEMENPARAQRMVVAVTEALASSTIRVLAGVRNDAVVAVLSDRRRQSGWTAERTNLSLRVEESLRMLGPAVLVGISADHPSTAFLPKALHEATVALDLASVDNRVVRFSGLPVRSLLVHLSARHVQSAPPGWIGALAALDAGSKGAVMETLRAVADADLNLQEAGRRLGKHPNTVYARLERVRAATGLDGRRFHDLTELLLGADCGGVDAPGRSAVPS